MGVGGLVGVFVPGRLGDVSGVKFTRLKHRALQDTVYTLLPSRCHNYCTLYVYVGRPPLGSK